MNNIIKKSRLAPELIDDKNDIEIEFTKEELKDFFDLNDRLLDMEKDSVLAELYKSKKPVVNRIKNQ